MTISFITYIALISQFLGEAFVRSGLAGSIMAHALYNFAIAAIWFLGPPAAVAFATLATAYWALRRA